MATYKRASRLAEPVHALIMELKEGQPLRVYGLKGCEFLEWRPIVFVQPPPKSYTCPHCGVVVGASHGCQQRYSCGHVLCRPCVVQLEDDGVSGCPLDPGSEVVEALSSHVAAPREARAAILNALKVFCLNHRHGCNFIGRLDRLVYHVRHDCRLNEVPCRECGRVFPHMYFRQHLERGCPAGLRRLSAGEAHNGKEAAWATVGSDGLPERARDVHGQDGKPERGEAAAANGLVSSRSNDWTVIGSPGDTAPRAVAPARSEDLECILVLKIPASSWYDRPTTAPSTAIPETEAAGIGTAPVTTVPDSDVLIDWPENPHTPPVLEWGADGNYEACLRGFRFKVRHMRAELDDSSGACTTKFAIFELLVKKATGDNGGDSSGAEWPLRWGLVSLALKHPLGEEGLRLQTFSSSRAAGGPGLDDQWSKVAVTAPVEWETAREFFLRDRADIVVRFV